LFIFIILAVSCTKDEMFDPTVQSSDTGALKSAAKLKIAVISDLHYMNPSLLPADPENDGYFQMYLAQDPKLIHFSDPILKEAISQLKIERPDIVLIPGDLTKDGELLNHESVKELLEELVNAGIKVFVVPGNHDINNSDALDFSTTPIPKPVATATPEDFTSVYGSFGYNDALYRDVNSLSYIGEVHEKLWILGIDACRYEDNEPGESPITGGRIKSETMVWIQEKMAEANASGITVLAMMHHGILQHYYGQEQLDPGYLVENWPENAAALMGAGIKLVFTGHYHANDISQISVGKNTFSDVETGSLVSAPIPYRIMTLDDNFIKIESRRITKIDYPFPSGVNFVSYSNMFLSAHLDGYFGYILQNIYGIPEEQAVVVAPFLRNGVMAHYAGDEKIKPEERKKLNQLALAVPPESAFLIDAINSFWTDLPIDDNKAHIKMK
jgi:predicted MPP superfamily phosphohydrolase